MGQIIKLGNLVQTISSRYVGFYPCFQAAPDSLVMVIDRSGKGNHAIAAGSGIGASAWSNANQFTSSISASTGANIPKAAAAGWNWNPTTKDSLVWSAKVTTPNTVAAGGETIYRTGTSNATGGWFIETDSDAFTGAIPGVRVKFYDTTAGVRVPMGFASLPANTETTVTLIVDGPGNQFYLFINGLLAAVSTGTNPASLTVGDTYTVQAAAAEPYIGGTTLGCIDVKKFRGLHYAIIPMAAGAIPDPAALAMRLHRHPYTALSASELP